MSGTNRRRFLQFAAAAALVPASGARADRQVWACATCDEDAQLAVVDVAAGRLVRRVPCLPDPRSIELVGGAWAVVCHTAVGAVSVLDRPSLSVVHVLRGFDEPRYVAAHPDGRHAYVTDSAAAALVAIDVVAGHRLGRVKLREWPRHVSIDGASAKLWVGLGSVSEHVAVVDVSNPRQPRFERLIRPPFLAHDVGFTPAGRHAWITAGEAGAMAVYDAAGNVARQLAADAGPQHVTFAAGRAYVTSGAAGTVRVFEAATGRQLRAALVAVGSYNIQAGHGLVLTPSLERGTLTVLDASGGVLHAVPVAASSHDACFLS